MKKLFVVLHVMCALYLNAYAESAHQAGGTSYSQQGVPAYAQCNHGVDGTLFRDPFFLPVLTNVQDATLLDAGCGAGPWSMVAAQHGAKVYGIDIQEGMIACAKKSAQEQGILATQFAVGSVALLPYENSFFDRAISINVGCNIPSDVFRAHFQEMYRTLKPGGQILITAPASFDTVFATEHDDASITQAINDVLTNLTSVDDDQIRSALSTLKTVLRATFVVREGKLILVTDEKILIEGEPIWRKIPGLVVPNYYHSEKAYIKELLAAGFNIEMVDRPFFNTADAWRTSSVVLGREYSYFHPFIIVRASK